MVTEIIIYKLKEQMNSLYWETFIKQSLPAMKKWNIIVLNYGFSLEDTSIFHLVRSFDSLENRNKILTEFYSSDDWKLGAREKILASIESYKSTVFENKKVLYN